MSIYICSICGGMKDKNSSPPTFDRHQIICESCTYENEGDSPGIIEASGVIDPEDPVDDLYWLSSRRLVEDIKK